MRFQSTLRLPQLSPLRCATSMSVDQMNAANSSRDRAEELQQLLDITSELGTLGDLDEFFQKFVVRAAQFLNFQRAFIAIADHGNCTVLWIAENGPAKPMNWQLPGPFASRLLASAEPLRAND